ncbi:MAG: hexose kinase [Defluviitaleaceae bacterium]|nr:hexose kinase [Defluviitaleaceae bacterium]
MITAVSMNPSIDLTLPIPSLTLGGSHRVAAPRQDFSGKAVNTAYALRNLGQPCQLLGFGFVENGDLLKKSLDDADVLYDFVAVEGAMRTNVKIFEETHQRMSEINQEGPLVNEASVTALFDKIIQVKTDVLILSGSLPQGVDKGIYGEIIKNTKAKVILDADGPAMLAGLEAFPSIIKPNIAEMERIVGEPLSVRDAQISAGRALLCRYEGLEAICLSLGEAGALMIGREGVVYAPAMDIPVRGVQGAGDSMVAGLALELLKLPRHKAVLPLEGLLKSAMAAAAASLIREGTLMCTKQGFDEMAAKVKVEEVCKWNLR